jgi:Cys-tRNA(Pro)/Cys-tRNA(Cys) deacylase
VNWNTKFVVLSCRVLRLRNNVPERPGTSQQKDASSSHLPAHRCRRQSPARLELSWNWIRAGNRTTCCSQMKTNATRQLDNLGIAYQLREYAVDPNDLSATKVAAQIGMPANQVFKTLVAKGDLNGILMAVVPGDHEVDLKALARISGNRKMELVPVSQLQQLTGYIRGGVTALAGKKHYPVYLDETALLYDCISVSAGVRGTQILIPAPDYIRAVGATCGAISRPAPHAV